MARKPVLFPRLSLLFLICSSCAWVGNGVAYGPVPVVVPVNGKEAVIGGAGGPEPVWRRIPGEVEGRSIPHPRSPPAEPAHVVRGGCEAMITPPPSLLARQDQGQIQALSNQLEQVSNQFRSVSQASQQVSQSSQQLSQSLQQATQRLSQTEQQLASARLQQGNAESASRSMSQASAEASRRGDEARASADRAISQAIQSASQSASRALSENMASLTSSMGASFSSALRLASQSAMDASRSAASVAQKAQADATALRDQANTQIQQAQGAALSVTQTALAVVGGIIGSSLLTGIVFVLVLRRKRNNKRRRLGRGGSESGINGNIGYPQLTGASNEAYSISSSKKDYSTSDDGRSSTYSTDDAGFRFPSDLKQPAATATSIPRKGVGYAVSYYGPRKSTINTTTTTTRGPPPKFQLGNPPPPRTTTQATQAATAAAAAVAGGGKFSLFPSPKATNPTNTTPPTAAASTSGAGQRASSGSVPTLDRWLRDGTDVSPFGTLGK
ncbi:hypothetical protein F5144DRAFT_339301 [Chaetomium tenue]|uniref:Uncharacterized protein n=1 Tax=Chaetomium tenue TaxID=1854479 RepID=A0ACB7NZT3_9PEZI|nr:hypothetical protein F5144DRAFT_339301 [Chaetomium globosum]